MIVTTTPDIAGKEIVEYKGIVFGEALSDENKGQFKLTAQKMEHERIAVSAKNDALAKLTAHAKKIGANAIVGVSFEFDAVTARHLRISSTGTAVVIK